MLSLTRRSLGVALSAVAASGVVGLPRRSAADSPPALPSWNDGPAKQAILDFVRHVTTPGGAQEFVRAYAQAVYGVPPEQVVGSSIATRYEVKDGRPELLRLPKVFFVDDGDGKAIGINLFIGKRPYAAFGNSGGDREMLQWTGAGDGARLRMLVHHHDAAREAAYAPAVGRPAATVGQVAG